MSSKESADGRRPTLPVWGPVNIQLHTHTDLNASGVSRKCKRKATKRKRTSRQSFRHELEEKTSFIKKRKDSLSDTVGTGHDVTDTTTESLTKTTSTQPHGTEHIQSGTGRGIVSLSERWELDSGFASEANSPISSGRCSPCIESSGSQAVAIDCEMVGTGPGGQCSELARCSVLDYDGNVLYDQYVLPVQPVTNYRRRWSGITREHLKQAVPFKKAREEILALLKDKLVIGHAIHNDFKALKYYHPWQMVRDTTSCRALRQMNGPLSKGGFSLKNLSQRLLNRNIQDGKCGHCSVEDARAVLDLYKLVEERWEKDLTERQQSRASALEPPLSHYMQDQYWPEDMDCSQ